jgi:hypothetical protein
LLSRHFLIKVENEYTELSQVNVDVPQSSVLGSLLYLLCTADLQTSPESTTATFAYDIAVETTYRNPATASPKLQTDLRVLAVIYWFKNREWKVTDPDGSTSPSLHEEKLAPCSI